MPPYLELAADDAGAGALVAGAAELGAGAGAAEVGAVAEDETGGLAGAADGDGVDAEEHPLKIITRTIKSETEIEITFLINDYLLN